MDFLWKNGGCGGWCFVAGGGIMDCKRWCEFKLKGGIMKIVFAILMGCVVLLAGCESEYYYSEDKNIQEAREDWMACYRDVVEYPQERYSYDYGDLQREKAGQCMRVKGYDTVEKDELDEHVEIEQGTVRGEQYWIAGEKVK